MKAISLLSGGLDSTLATKLIKEQGIGVLAVNFTSPFCLCGGRPEPGCRHKAVEMAAQLGVELKLVSLSEEFIEDVKRPKYGYGSTMNPCIDCRIMKFKAAKKIMIETGASFIVTGEVLGQRPMSQNKRAIELIEKESGLGGLVVRPLCAGAIEPSLPEKNGWVKRDKFGSITGRSRQGQLKLVEELRIESYACPAGGCLLTDKNFGQKVKDLIDSGMFDMASAKLFRYGRYFSIGRKFKLSVGRNKEENDVIKNLAGHGDLLIMAREKGPVAVGRGKISAEAVRAAVRICAHYCRHEAGASFDCAVIPAETAFYMVKEKVLPNEIEKYLLTATGPANK